MHAPELLHCSVLESRSAATPHDFHSHAQLSTLKLIACDDDADELQAFECDDTVNNIGEALQAGSQRVQVPALPRLAGSLWDSPCQSAYRGHPELSQRRHFL